jgi:hypothetical protein
MAKEYRLDVPHILQNDCYNDVNERCGAACAQMVLHDIDPGRPLIPGEQEALFDRITAPPPATSIWHNPPRGVIRVLNEDKPAARRPDRGFVTLPPIIQALFSSIPPDPAIDYKFIILGNDSPDDSPGIIRAISVLDQIAQIELLSRLLIRTVAIKGAGPIIAVREDNAHWVVVNGFHVHDDYDDSDLDQRDRIKAILLRNPLGRYTYRNITCGSLPERELEEITGHQCEMNPYVQDVVAYETWVREYLFADWAETFVTLCDESEPVASGILEKLRELEPEPVMLSSATTVEGNQYLDATAQQGDSMSFSITYNSVVRIVGISGYEEPKRPITADDAVKQARRVIEDFNLSELNENVTPQNILRPVKVNRLDRIDGDYYLVPVGEENRISALISISVTGEFLEATIWPNRHYIAPFERHPDFKELTSGQKSRLRGKKIRLTPDGPLLTITSVTRDATTPYVWRPSPSAFSMSRPFLNLKITVQERPAPISFYLPVDDYCLPVDDTGAISLPSPNYLELLADCIKQKAGSLAGEVLVVINRRGNTVMVMYKSNQTLPIEDELKAMTEIICQCLKTHPSDGVTHFRIKAFASNAFLTKRRGGGDDFPLGAAPASGGGGDGIPIGSCG